MSEGTASVPFPRTLERSTADEFDAAEPFRRIGPKMERTLCVRVQSHFSLRHTPRRSL